MSHNSRTIQSILVYTRGVATEGGGGRRVSMELLHNFNALGVYAYAWSVLPLFPETLYHGKYNFDAYHVYEDWSTDPARLDQSARRRLAGEFLCHLRSKRPNWILFDTEYSFREFQFMAQGNLEAESLPPLAVLVHDQLWKYNIGYLSAFTDNNNARLLAERSPYPKLIHYTERLLGRIRRQHILPVLECVEARGNSALFGIQRSLAARLDELKNRLCWRWRNNRYTMGLFRELEGIRAVKQDMRKADAIFCLTRRSAKESVAAYSMEKSRVFVACGCYDPGHTAAGSRADISYRKRFDTGTDRVLFAFSRIAPEKNLELILLAFSLAYRTRPDMQLWIAGLVTEEHQNYSEALMQFSRSLGIQGSTFFLWSVSDEEMEELYTEADAFICAQVEDFNLSTYNALRFFKPIVVSRAYDFPQALADSQAVLSDNCTVEDFADSILKALHTPLAFRECERRFILSLTFENYARTVLDGLASCGNGETRCP